MNLGNLKATVDFQYCSKCTPDIVHVAQEEGWQPKTVILVIRGSYALESNCKHRITEYWPQDLP